MLLPGDSLLKTFDVVFCCCVCLWHAHNVCTYMHTYMSVHIHVKSVLLNETLEL